MRVALHDYSGKGSRLATALTDAGHELVDDKGDVALVDLDHPDTGGPLVERHERAVTYPHGGNPILEWDGNPPHPHIRLHFVHGPGHAAVFALYGHPVPAVPIGFTYCDLAPPRYPTDPRRVLFAPSHPMDDGTMDPLRKRANTAALEVLLAAGLDLTVRCWGRREDWGLPDIDEGALLFDWLDGGTLDTADIDEADLVVADGTVATLAVARGCPTLFIGSDVDPGSPHFGRYARFMRYPYDVADGPLDGLLAAVCQPNDAVARWREQFVGGPFDAELAVALIEAVAE